MIQPPPPSVFSHGTETGLGSASHLFLAEPVRHEVAKRFEVRDRFYIFRGGNERQVQHYFPTPRFILDEHIKNIQR